VIRVSIPLLSPPPQPLLSGAQDLSDAPFTIRLPTVQIISTTVTPTTVVPGGNSTLAVQVQHSKGVNGKTVTVQVDRVSTSSACVGTSPSTAQQTTTVSSTTEGTLSFSFPIMTAATSCNGTATYRATILPITGVMIQPPAAGADQAVLTVQGPTAPPVVTAVNLGEIQQGAPIGFIHVGQTDLTLTGSNLLNLTASVPQDPPDDQTPTCSSPPQVQVLSATGTSATLRVTTQNECDFDFYMLTLANGVADPQGKGTLLLRVVPVGPLIDLYTPGTVEPGLAYVLTIAGKQLSSVSSNDPALTLSSVETASDGTEITGILTVANTASPHIATLTVTGGGGSLDLEVKIVASQTDMVPVATEPVNLTEGMQVAGRPLPPLLLASFQFNPRWQRRVQQELSRTGVPSTKGSDLNCQVSEPGVKPEPTAAPANHIRFDPCAGVLGYRAFGGEPKQLALGFCLDENGIHWNAQCAQQMVARVPQQIGTIVLSLFARLDVTLRWRTFFCIPVSWPSLCVEFSAGIEIVGGPGVVIVWAPCLALYDLDLGPLAPRVLYPRDFGLTRPYFGFYVTTPPQYVSGSCFQILTPPIDQFRRFVNAANEHLFLGLWAQVQIPTCSCPPELLKMNAQVWTFSDFLLGFASVFADQTEFVLANAPAAVVSLRSGGVQPVRIQRVSFDNTSIVAGDPIGTKLRVTLLVDDIPPGGTATVAIQQIRADPPSVQVVPAMAEQTVLIPDTVEEWEVAFDITALSTSATGSVTYSATLCATGNSQLLPGSTNALLLVQGNTPQVTISGPSSVNVGEPVVQIMATTNPPGGMLSNWRVTSGDSNCVFLNQVGQFRAYAPGTVGIRVDYTANGQTMTSNELTITANAVAQYVTITYTSDADMILGTYFTNTNDVNYIKQRVRDNLTLLFVQRAGANFVVADTLPQGITSRTTVEVRGNSPGTQGGEAGFDLMNRTRMQTGVVYIGTGSLDLANHQNDPVMSTPSINERRHRDRVADAIARLAAHEIGHALGLVPQSSEIANNGLAAKLNVTGLGLNGTSTHHNPVSNDVNLMQPKANLSSERTWNITLYEFEGKERTYLDRILP
jgi:hypothetical protein